MDDINRLKTAKLECENSLLFFTRYFFKARFGSKFIINDHHIQICKALEKVYRGEIKNLVINMPPRYGKTELAVINFIAWGFALAPDSKFIHLSYGDKLVLDSSSQIRELIKHESYQELWDVDTKVDSDAKGLWKTDSDGGLLATSAGGVITGFGAGVMGSDKFKGAIVIDDPLKPDDAESDVKRNAVNDRLVNTIMSRRNNSKETPIILIMQRLHEEDMTGFVLSGATGEHWDVLKLPALSEDNQALWPQKHSVQDLLDMQGAAPYMFSGQYQQEPTPESGVFFQRDMFVPVDEIPEYIFKYGASDYAVSKDEGDYTEHGVIGVDPNKDLYLIDWWYGQDTPNVTVSAWLDLVETHKPVSWANEKGVIMKSIGELMEEMMNDRDVHCHTVNYASTKDKVMRAGSIQGRMAQRKIYYPRNAHWAGRLIDQCVKFPLGKHDDGVDVLSLMGRMINGIRAGEVPKKEEDKIVPRGFTFDDLRKSNLRA